MLILAGNKRKFKLLPWKNEKTNTELNIDLHIFLTPSSSSSIIPSNNDYNTHKANVAKTCNDHTQHDEYESHNFLLVRKFMEMLEIKEIFVGNKSQIWGWLNFLRGLLTVLLID